MSNTQDLTLALCASCEAVSSLQFVVDVAYAACAACGSPSMVTVAEYSKTVIPEWSMFEALASLGEDYYWQEA